MKKLLHERTTVLKMAGLSILLVTALASTIQAWSPHVSCSASGRTSFTSFSNGRRCRTYITPTQLYSSSRGDPPAVPNHDHTDIFRTFLNQCCVQSFMFLLRTSRDTQTIRWLDNLTQPVIEEGEWKTTTGQSDDDDGISSDDSPKLMDQTVASELLRYHGLNAMNTHLYPTWEDYFLTLLEQNDVALVVETGDPRFPEYNVDIDPARLCARMISVREQIAREFDQDLSQISTAGQQIFSQYWDEIEKVREKLQAQRDASAEDSSSLPGRDAVASSPSMSQDGELEESMKGFSKQYQWFLDWHPLFDDGPAPSPLRRNNYDLLVLLATQEAVKRLLQVGVEDDTPEQEAASTDFLFNFYTERLLSHFTGPQRYRRADDFIEELMLTPTRIIPRNDGTIVVVNPLNVAELLLITRDALAREWQQIAKDAPVEHAEIRRRQLNRMMGKPMDEMPEQQQQQQQQQQREEEDAANARGEWQ